MIQIPSGLGDLAKHLRSALGWIAWPAALAGGLYLALPDLAIRAIGLVPGDPVGRWIAGLAILIGGSVALFSVPAPARRAFTRIAAWWRHRLIYCLLPKRSKLWLGPAALGGVSFLYLDPDDEAAQRLVDARIMIADVRGRGYLRSQISWDGKKFIAVNRRLLRRGWTNPTNKQDVNAIVKAMGLASEAARWGGE